MANDDETSLSEESSTTFGAYVAHYQGLERGLELNDVFKNNEHVVEH